jgi:hypothetical protein
MEKLAQVRQHCQANPGTVLFDEPGDALFDVFAQRALPLSSTDLQTVESRTDKDTKAPYLLLVYGSGRQVALTIAGIGFSPRFEHSGPQELPEVVCFRDYQGLVDRFKHDLYGHPDVAPTRSTVRLLMSCIAILDGARAVGFDISREERELEKHLDALEKRAPPA